MRARGQRARQLEVINAIAKETTSRTFERETHEVIMLHEVLKHVFNGKLKPVVDRAFPLSEIRAAHQYLESSKMFGKVVLNP